MEEKREVKFTKVLHAPIDTVWDAWTNPKSMQEWLSPEGMTNPEVGADLSVDGAYRIVMEGHNMPDPKHNGRLTVGGKYLVIEKPRRLVFTWLWEGSPVDTHTTKVEIHLRKVDADKTEMTLIHSGFADDNMQKEHTMGWTSTFHKLEKFLNG